VPGPEDYESLGLPLPEPPPLGPRGTWASEHPIAALLAPVGSSAMIAAYVTAGTSRFGFPALFVVAAGFPLISMGVQYVLRRIDARRVQRLREEFPFEPWRYDHVWDERGERRTWIVRLAEAADRARGRFVWVMAGTLGLVVCLAAGRFWSALALAGGVLVTWIAWTVWRMHGSGDARLYFAKFPFHPGERVTLRFGMGAGGATFQRAEFRLSEVNQPAEQRGPGFGGGERIRSMCERRPPGALPGSDFDIEVSFDVPAGASGTRLSGGAPRYWVLDVLAATTSGPYAETFLIPIYARPCAPATEGGPTAEADPNFPA
jgi:hypothetical protein